MANDKIVLCTHTSDQGDILKDWLEWHLALGVDAIIAQDCNSSDNSQLILTHYARTRPLRWFLMPERNMSRYSSPNTLAKMAIELGAAWIIMIDVDEFLCPQGRTVATLLHSQTADDVTAITVPCFNMTGRLVDSSQCATEALTLRIDRPVTCTDEQLVSGDIPVPYVFMSHPPKTIVRASAFVEYGPGTHTVLTAHGRTEQRSELRILHYPIRRFDVLHTKSVNAAAFFEDNTHLPASWFWHWRRWVRLQREGRLREEYDSQFVQAAQTEQLIRDGICSEDDTIASWIRKKPHSLGRERS
jgi:hypothetical protein